MGWVVRLRQKAIWRGSGHSASIVTAVIIEFVINNGFDASDD
jgi:hypothetical protein